MEHADLEVRRAVYDRIAAGRPAPSASEIAAALDRSVGEVEASFRRLHDAHALVLHPGTTEIWMANPFSAVETVHRVEREGRGWFANCAWDALGVLGAHHADGRVESVCADCDEPVELEVRDGRLAAGAELIAHVLVPAARWWDDIGFT